MANLFLRRVDEQTLRAWLFGSNKDLDDKMPIALLTFCGEECFARVMQAAKRFISLDRLGSSQH